MAHCSAQDDNRCYIIAHPGLTLLPIWEHYKRDTTEPIATSLVRKRRDDVKDKIINEELGSTILLPFVE